MKTNLKIMFIIISILSLSIGIIKACPVLAIEPDMDEIYEEEISKSIITGDGTAENPYIIDEETAPMFNQYLEEKGKEAIATLQYSDEITLYGVLDGVLSGTSHSSQTKGAYWVYTKNAPSAVSNGNIWMKKVEYISKSDVINICSGFASSSLINTFKGTISSIAGKGLTAGVNYLVNKGFSKAVATSLAKWVGCGSTLFSAAILLGEVNTFFSQKPYLDARDAGKGLIHAEYNTSYQGQWYSHSLSEVWSNYPTAKEPGSSYGTGSYTSR